MLTAIPKDELPTRGGRPRNPMREFAARTLDEFMEASAPGDFFEVSGWPALKGRDEASTAAEAASALRHEAFLSGRRDDVRVRRSGCRVFAERLEPIGQRVARIDAQQRARRATARR